MDPRPRDEDEERTDYSRPSNVRGSGISPPIRTARNRQDLHGQGSGGEHQQTRTENQIPKEKEPTNSLKRAPRNPQERQKRNKKNTENPSPQTTDPTHRVRIPT